MVKGRAIKSNKEKRTVVSNKKKERDQFKKEMDMVLLKNKIGEIMKKISSEKAKIENYKDKYKNVIEIMNEKYTENNIYQNMLQNYMKNEYTLICISFINKIIIDSKRTHLDEYEGKYNLNKMLNDIAKELFLNEYELILLSLYLENINLPLYNELFNFEDSLLYLGFFIKKITLSEEELEPILYYLNKANENFKFNYERWYKILEKKLNELYFNHKEINQRFREYNQSFNEYCRNNYIDYNYIVDRILTMSLPYVDIKKEKDNIDNVDNLINTDNINNINNIHIDIKKDEVKTIEELNANLINNNNLNENNFNCGCGTNNDINEINKKIIEQNQNKLKAELDFNNNNNNNILYKNNITDPLANMKSHLNNLNNFNNISNLNTNISNLNNINNIRINPSQMTANSLLHSLSRANKFHINDINNKILVSNFNNFGESKADINNINNINTHNIPINNNIFLNQIQTPSQTSLFNQQQKSSFLDLNIFDKNNNSRLFEGEDEVLKQILKNSNDNGYIRSSLSFDSPKFPYGILMSNNNLGNVKNPNFFNSNLNSDMNNKKNKNNEVPFKPLNIICNKSVVRNIINNQNFICNNCDNNKPNNN